MKYSKAQVEEAKGYLLEALKPGDKVYTILRQVSRSGMSRHISTIIRGKDGNMDITHLVARALGERRNENDGGLVVGGCGMDMGFEVVYRLGYVLWPEGFKCPGTRCHSNDHSNGDRNYKRHLHRDGGYALRHEWL
jgi:hypothetical protein